MIIDNIYAGSDPSLRVVDGVKELGSKVVIDATESVDPSELSLPSKEFMMKALDAWKDVGLPEFDIPKRLEYRLERS